MIVRRFLSATALAVLIGAHASAAWAVAPKAFRGAALAPHRARSALTTQTIADVHTVASTDRRTKPAGHTHASSLHPRAQAHAAAATHTRHKAQSRKAKSGEFKLESTPLSIGASTPAPAHSSSGGSSILRTLLGLGFVIALIYGVAWFLRRLKRSREAQASGRGLASVATLPIGAGRSLHLIRAGTDVILVGASEHGVAPIRVYTEEEALANGVLSEDGGEAALRDAAGAFASPSNGGIDAQARPLGPPPTSGSRALDVLRRLTVRP